MNRKQFMKNLWLWKCEMPEKKIEIKSVITYDELKQKERCPYFEQLRLNRLIMGGLRYGQNVCKNKCHMAGENCSGDRIDNGQKAKYDRIGSIEKRLGLYKETGNDEILVDVANLAMMEFIEGSHPLKYFNSIDDGIHTEKI